MALFFKEEDIEEFRECFYLYARQGQVRTINELATIMRSLRLSPSNSEMRKFLKQNDGKLSFAKFLDAMAEQSKREHLPDEITLAFREQDPRRTGLVSVDQLRRILLHWGDRLGRREVEQVFHEANIPARGHVKYADFINVMCAPVPDYY